jgi:hypothetical protein
VDRVRIILRSGGEKSPVASAFRRISSNPAEAGPHA